MSSVGAAGNFVEQVVGAIRNYQPMPTGLKEALTNTRHDGRQLWGMLDGQRLEVTFPEERYFPGRTGEIPGVNGNPPGVSISYSLEHGDQFLRIDTPSQTNPLFRIVYDDKVIAQSTPKDLKALQSDAPAQVLKAANAHLRLDRFSDGYIKDPNQLPEKFRAGYDRVVQAAKERLHEVLGPIKMLEGLRARIAEPEWLSTRQFWEPPVSAANPVEEVIDGEFV